MQDENFAFAIMEKAFAQPDQVAFDSAGGRVTYRRFADLVVHFARRMQEFGVNHSSRLSFVMNDSVIACVAITATSLLGAQWRRLEGDTPAAGVPSITHSFAGMGDSAGGAFEFTRSWFEATTASATDLAGFPGHASADDTWLIATSSGTTGRQKHMPITYAAAWQRIVNVSDLEDRQPLVAHSLFDATSYVGARSRLTNLLVGGTNIANARWSQAIEKGVTRVMGSPAQIAGVLVKQPVPETRIRACRVTGAQVTAKFVELALRHFEEVQVLYGSTEAGIMTLARFTDRAPFDGSVGPLARGAAVEIVDPSDLPVEPGREGEIRVRTNGMVTQYLGEPELSAKVFRGGWFHPGDLGYFDAAGILHLTGRTTDVINMGGVKFNAADLDELIQLHPDIADGFCFIDRTEDGHDRLAAIVSTQTGAEVNQLRGLRAFAAKRLGKARILKRVYIAATVPRNENGKPQRREAIELVRDLPRIEFD
ncbi:class I adenylate-forming enzyme family protein [Devosia sp. CN2-171]|uniref:class I adenylate-forming enzyme family protein n=1 Tax=Devosia sp. CN2-171 TaxID=3400909 RepID=UPI003BF8A3DF